jgi:hypothetical protein
MSHIVTWIKSSDSVRTVEPLLMWGLLLPDTPDYCHAFPEPETSGLLTSFLGRTTDIEGASEGWHPGKRLPNMAGATLFLGGGKDDTDSEQMARCSMLAIERQKTTLAVVSIGVEHS